MTTTLYGFGPMFGIPSPSPFVMKADIQLQMLGVSFERATADLDSVSKRKAPYVYDDGQLIQDSTFIRSHFEAKLGRDLDAGLTAAERGQAWALERLLEDRLMMIVAYERWLVDENFEKGPALFFAGVPEETRQKLCDEVRQDLRDMMWKHGIGRHSREERLQLADRDIAAVAAMLGSKPFLFGASPTAIDASAFGTLVSAGAAFFDTPLVGMIEDHPNLRAFLARMQSRYFAEERWPALAA